MFTAGGCIYIAGGLVCFFLYPPKKRRFSLKYHGLCGFLVIAYFYLFSVGLGLAKNRVQAVEVGLLNYLWPLLTLVFSVIAFRKRVSLLLMTGGIVLSFCGFALSSSVLAGVPLILPELWEQFCGNPLPHLVMTGAAVSWAVYSNILASLDKETPKDAMPYFMLIGGIFLLLMRFPFQEESVWNFTVFWQLLFMAVFPIGAGYYCWDRAMLTPQRDSAIIASYLTPLFSAIGCAVFLHVALPAAFYGACLLVIGGALLCRYAIRKKVPPER